MSQRETSHLQAKWDRRLQVDHIEHEDIIHFLQHNPDSGSVSYLKRAIEMKPSLKYLDYDDYGAYYKKCLWALQAIGTPDALALIQKCAHSHQPALREEAAYRLTKIRANLP